MKNFGLIFLLVIVLGTLAVGCPNVNSATLRVDNLTAYHTIVTVNAVPSGSSTWGPNRLRAPIPPGYFDDIMLAPGTYDLRAVTATGATLIQYGIYFDSNTARNWTIYDQKSNISETISDLSQKWVIAF